MFSSDPHRLSSSRLLLNGINKHLALHHWSLRQLSSRSDIPYDSLKKLANGKIRNPSLHSALLLASAFHCSLDSLLFDIPSFLSSLRSLPPHSLALIRSLIDLERSLSFPPHPHSRITLFIPSSSLSGMSLDMPHIRTLDACRYRKRYGDRLMCAIQITVRDYHPVFMLGDIVLVARDRRPVAAETAVFLVHGKIRIGRYREGNVPRLDPVNGIGVPVFLDDPDAFVFFGYILTVYRQMEEQ